MARVNVADLVAEHCRELRFIVEPHQQGSRHTDRSGGESVGIEVIRIQAPIRIGQVRPVAHRMHPRAHLAHIGIDRRLLDRPQILRELLRRQLPVERDLLRFAHADEDGLTGDGRSGAARKERRGQACAQQLERLAPRHWPAAGGIARHPSAIVHSVLLRQGCGIGYHPAP